MQKRLPERKGALALDWTLRKETSLPKTYTKNVDISMLAQLALAMKIMAFHGLTFTKKYCKLFALSLKEFVSVLER
jgi:hypothetical protein